MRTKNTLKTSGRKKRQRYLALHLKSLGIAAIVAVIICLVGVARTEESSVLTGAELEDDDFENNGSVNQDAATDGNFGTYIASTSGTQNNMYIEFSENLRVKTIFFMNINNSNIVRNG